MSEGREEEASSYLVSSTRLRELFRQEEAARLEDLDMFRRNHQDEDFLFMPERAQDWIRGGFVERAFRRDIDVTTPDHLVSVGLTWSNLKELIRNDERGNGVLWMGQDTYLQEDHAEYDFPELEVAPRGFRQLFKGTTMKEGGRDDFDFIVFGTNPSSDSYGYMMNLLAEIISLDESTAIIVMGGGDVPTSMLHCPTTALERLVSKPASERRLRLYSNLRISNAQSQVLFSGSCSDNIKLDAGFEIFEDGGALMIEAIRSSRFPSKVRFCKFQFMPETTFVEFVGAMRNNQSLKEIDLSHSGLSEKRMAVLLPALVAANNRLDSLSLRCHILSSDLWQLLWSLIAQNLYINHLDLRDTHFQNLCDDVKVQRDKCIVKALKSNTVLTDLDYSEVIQAVVLPMLELNRFRPRIQAIRKVPNDAVRWGLLGKALLHPQFHQYPFLLFHLLLVNSDGLATLVKPASEETENSIAW